MVSQFKLIGILVSAVFLSACAGITAKNQAGDFQRQVKSDEGARAAANLEFQRNNAARHKTVEDVAKPFTGNQQVAAPKNSSWPANLRRDSTVLLNFSGNKVDENNMVLIPIADFAHQIFLATGVPVQVRSEALRDGSDKPVFVTIPANYKGSVPEILDQLAGRQRIFSQMSDGRLELFRTATKSFLLSTSLGDTKFTIDASSGGGEAGFSGNSSSNFTGNVDSTKAMVDSIKLLLSKGAPAPVFNNGTGTLTVTDTPDVLESIAVLIDQQNKYLKKKVLFEVEVVRYSSSDAGESSVDLSALYNRITDLTGGAFSFNGPAVPPGVSDASLGFNVVPGARGSSRFVGSSLVLKALNTFGQASTLDRYSLETINRTPAVRAFNKTFDYVNETNASTTLAGVAVAQKTKTENVGRTLILIPALVGNNEAFVDLSIRESVLNPFRTNSIGTGATQQSVQLLDKDTELVRQRLLLRNGETRVLAGVGSKNSTGNEQSYDKNISSIFGGSANGSKTDSQYFLIVTMRFGD